ncbi:MAG: peptidylprolyl isomerase [Bacteroidales bacterium]|nr:peptidylprolyl isomerase [Bacteroidales bacterium]
MKIEKNAVVSLTYTLKQNSADGELIETCDASRPLEFIYDNGVMIPHFEQHIKGLEDGGSFEFTLSPEEAYGQVNQDAMVNVSKDIFVIDGQLREDLLEIGKIIPMRNDEGQPLNGMVREIKDDTNEVLLDFNHPLAGKTLHFSGKIESVRPATEEELKEGLQSEGCGCDDSDGNCDDNNGACGSGCGCN